MDRNVSTDRDLNRTASPAERARRDRYHSSRVTFARLRPTDGSPESLCVAEVRDVSLLGIGVTIFRPVETGMTFLLDASQGDEAQWAQYRIVRWAPSNTSGFEVGAELIRSAPGQAEKILSALLPAGGTNTPHQSFQASANHDRPSSLR